jgi:hypothetical protein
MTMAAAVRILAPLLHICMPFSHRRRSQIVPIVPQPINSLKPAFRVSKVWSLRGGDPVKQFQAGNNFCDDIRLWRLSSES